MQSHHSWYSSTHTTVYQYIPYGRYFFLRGGGGGGGAFSLMTRFVMIRVKKNCGRVKSIPHPSCTRRAMASSFQSGAMY